MTDLNLIFFFQTNFFFFSNTNTEYSKIDIEPNSHHHHHHLIIFIYAFCSIVIYNSSPSISLWYVFVWIEYRSFVKTLFLFVSFKSIQFHISIQMKNKIRKKCWTLKFPLWFSLMMIINIRSTMTTSTITSKYIQHHTNHLILYSHHKSQFKQNNDQFLAKIAHRTINLIKTNEYIWSPPVEL